MSRGGTVDGDDFNARFTRLWKMRGFPSRAACLRHAKLEPMTVARWQRGETRPQARLLERLADTLAVSTDVILGRAPMPESLPRIDQEEDAVEEGPLAELRQILAESGRPLTREDEAWLRAAPNFRRMSVGSLLDAVRANRTGMTEPQRKASTEATEAAREQAEQWGVTPKGKR